jgi:hypothetical protein
MVAVAVKKIALDEAAIRMAFRELTSTNAKRLNLSAECLIL